MNFLDEVRLKRKKLADVLSDDEYSGIRDIVEELYPDKAHFIYELLQNAEDTGATEVSFELTDQMFVFEHNGRPFNKNDVWGITNFGKGTKKDQDDKIGRFGVGFKAVFAYSETPHIWSPMFSFKITELVLPSPIASRLLSNDKTRFEFPFDNAKKPADAAYEEVKGGLEELSETTLLFLTNLHVIRWKIGQNLIGEIRRVQHSINHIEVLKKEGETTTSRSHFLCFKEPVKELPCQNVSIAYAMDFLPNIKEYSNKVELSKQLKIIPATQGRVAVFFPAEKENSGLRFHLHAPFVPELSRASIKETPANKPLFSQLAKLAASSLHSVRDFKMLTGDFLGVMPNLQDNIPVRYQGIRKSIIDEMNTEPLTPTHTKSHEPAKNLLQAKASIKELLPVKDIEFLVNLNLLKATQKKETLSEEKINFLINYDESSLPRWAIGASQKNSNQDRFLSGLDIQEWDFPQFREMLQNKTSTETSSSRAPHNITPQDVMNWLAAKPVDWHQQMYSLIHNESKFDGRAEYLHWQAIEILKPLKIVRLNNGNYSTGDKCYFPNDSIKLDELIPLVDLGVYSSGKNKSQQEEARKLLKEIGVREIGETEHIKSILQQRYVNQPEALDDHLYLKDLNLFIALLEKEPQTCKMFSTYYIFKNASNQWVQPKQVFLDVPFLETDLSAYYDAYYETIDKDAEKEALSDWYQSDKISLEKLTEFARMTGAEDELKLLETNCNRNSKRQYLHSAPGNATCYGIDRDYCLPLLDKVIDAKNIKVSRVIWRAMCRHSAGKLVAQYRKSKSGEPRYAPSLIVNLLESKAWIPQRGNDEVVFVLPVNASMDLLPEGFPFDKGDEWLKAIRFGEEEQQRSEAHKKKRETAKEIGFPDENSLNEGLWFASRSLEERQSFKDDIERKRKFVLPDDAPRNPEHRDDRVGQQASEAPGRETEKRQRSVSLDLEEVKKAAAQYLRQQYTNNDGEMICQICKAPLPFKLDNGSYYFEKEEFLTDLEKRYYQNYLALCPNHSAMFQHTNGSKEFLSEMFQELASNELKVIIAQKDMSIYFTATHRADLHSVLRSVKNSAKAQDSMENQ